MVTGSGAELELAAVSTKPANKNKRTTLQRIIK